MGQAMKLKKTDGIDNHKDLDKIKLRPLTIQDFELVWNWSRDTMFCLANGWALYQSSEQLYNWWLQCVFQGSDDFVRLGIEWNGDLIGYADLANLNSNTAELGIAIGESKLWGNGIGYRAALCTIQYGASKLGVTTFYAETVKTNIRSRKMLEKIGFKEVGRSDEEANMHVNEQLIRYQLHM